MIKKKTCKYYIESQKYNNCKKLIVGFCDIKNSTCCYAHEITNI